MALTWLVYSNICTLLIIPLNVCQVVLVFKFNKRSSIIEKEKYIKKIFRANNVSNITNISLQVMKLNGNKYYTAVRKLNKYVEIHIIIYFKTFMLL